MKTLAFIAFILFRFACSAQITETIKAGSYLVNMGVIPQTISNGLKPYGLVYDLLKNYKIPVKWAINPSKLKDGIDFTHNSINYSGGTFIIPYEYRTPAVNSAITSWESQGVVGQTAVADFTTTIYRTIHHPPIWTLDKANGTLVVAYFNNAGIPSSAYGGSSSSSWKDPSQLISCDDIFVLPHADPTWASHNNLYYWNLDFKGNIWAGCHSVSELENITDPGNTIQLNFLSTTGLIPRSSHNDGSLPFQYNYPDDPVMQFAGIADGATNNGSERIFLPKSGGAWRSTTKIGIYDATQADVPALSPGPATVLSYGRGFGSNTRGWVMYEGGHNHNTVGTTAERVAAQRAFLNFSFFSTSDKNAWFDIQLDNIPETLVPNNTTTISFTVPTTINLNEYVVQWSSSCGGTFSSTGDPHSVNYTAPGSAGACVITANLVNACNREVFTSKGTYIAAVLSVSVSNFNAAYSITKHGANMTWESSTNDQIGSFLIEKSENGLDFTAIGVLMSSGNSGISRYAFNDNKKIYVDTYYRLKILMHGGTTRYSTIVKVKSEANTALTGMAGNSFNNQITFVYFSQTSQIVALRLTDITGRSIENKLVAVKKGMNTINWPINSKLISGIDFLTVSETGIKGDFQSKTYKVLVH